MKLQIKKDMNKTKTTNLLLINPWIYDFSAFDLWAKPLGLLYIAGVLRKNNYNISYIDCVDIHNPGMPAIMGGVPKRKGYGTGMFHKQNIQKPAVFKKIPRKYSRYGITPDIFRKELMGIDPPQIILITSMMTYWYPGVIEAIKIVREIFPNLPIILGGIYATLCYQHALKTIGADFVLAGEGEIKLLDLLKDLTGQKPTYLPDPDDLNSYPYPAFDLLTKIDYIPLLTSRGCPYNCAYCASSQLGGKFRQRNPSLVVDEIEFWQDQYRVLDFAFYDDALLENPEQHIIPLLDEIIKRGIKVNFHSPNGLRIRNINTGLAFLMKRAGFKTVRLSLESADPARQAETGKKATNEEFQETITNFNKAGFSPSEIEVYLLVGLPGQSYREIEGSIDFIIKLGTKPLLAEYSPLPGTSLWKEAIRSSCFNLKKEPLFQNNSILPCQSENFTPKHLNLLKKRIKENFTLRLAKR